jgi:hypothetical protein
MSKYQHITIEDDGRLLAEAHVRSSRRAVHARLRVVPGQLPAGTGTRLVDAVLDLSTAPPGTTLRMSLPGGGGEMLDRMRQRCTAVSSYTAGPSCRLEALTPDS